jgi:hypothetical protein
MKKFVCAVATAALALSVTPAAWAKDKKGSSARQQQSKETAQIPRCTRKLGALAIVEPDCWTKTLRIASGLPRLYSRHH